MRHEERPIAFIVWGAAKSGTTWVQRMLCAHPRVHCGESRPFGDYFDPSNPSQPHISAARYSSMVARHLDPAGAVGAEALTHAVVDAIARTARTVSGKPVYGEKLTPFPGTGREAAEALHRYRAGMPVVHLVRDARDVIVSGAAQHLNLRLRRARPDEAEEIRASLEAASVPDDLFKFFLSLWIDSVSGAQRAAELFARFSEIRYERLLADPRREFARLLRSIGVDADDAVVADCVEAASFERLSGGRERGAEDRTSFFRKGVAGDWVNWLTPDQQRAVLDRAGHALASLGYQTELAA